MPGMRFHLKPERLCHRRWAGVALLAAALIGSGCQTASFYKQAIRGQCQIVLHQEPIKDLLASAATPDALKEKFQLILTARSFAEKELKLPAGRHYLNYVDVHRQSLMRLPRTH